MKIRHFYAGLCVPGAVLPWWQLLPWALEHGLNLPLLLRALFANAVSSAFAIDLVITALVLCCFILLEGGRAGVRHLWLPILGALLVGVSFGFPLFLYMRERQLEKGAGLSR
jgi:hypothetical protein